MQDFWWIVVEYSLTSPQTYSSLRRTNRQMCTIVDKLFPREEAMKLYCTIERTTVLADPFMGLYIESRLPNKKLHGRVVEVIAHDTIAHIRTNLYNNGKFINSVYQTLGREHVDIIVRAEPKQLRTFLHPESYIKTGRLSKIKT